jgi:ABC-type polar amino acid transport system ATPase subunit
MRSIIGLQTPDEGEIEVFGEQMIGRDEEEAKHVRRRWGILFQGGALFSTLTVAEKRPGADQGILSGHRAGPARRDRRLQDRDVGARRRCRRRNSRPSCPAA